MTRRPALTALALLLGAAAWAGGSIDTNPTTFRPRILTSAVRPFQPRPTAARPRQPATPVPPRVIAASTPHVLALRGVTVEGNTIDLPLPTELLLTDALPVPSEPLADLELDLSTGETRTVAIEDPDAAADAGEVWLDETGDLAVVAP